MKRPLYISLGHNLSAKRADCGRQYTTEADASALENLSDFRQTQSHRDLVTGLILFILTFLLFLCFG